MCKESNHTNQHVDGTLFPVPTDEVNCPTVSTPRLERVFEKVSKRPLKVKNILTLGDDDPKKSLSQDELKKLYNKELVGCNAFRFCSTQVYVSDLKNFEVTNGTGVISIGGNNIGFSYGQMGNGNITFKARLGYSKSLECSLCIVKTPEGHYTIPDYLIFRGELVQRKKDLYSTFHLAYAAIDDFFDYNVNTEYKSHRAGDFFFRVLTLGLLGGLADESGVN